LVSDDDTYATSNVVYKEIFQNVFQLILICSKLSINLL